MRVCVFAGLRFEVCGVAVLQVCCPAFVSTLLYKASVKHYYIGLLPDSASDRSHLSHSPPQKKTQETAKNPPAGLPSAQQRDFFLPKTFPPFVGAGHAPPAVHRGTRCPRNAPRAGWPARVPCNPAPTNEGPPASIAGQGGIAMFLRGPYGGGSIRRNPQSSGRQ